MRDLIFSKKFIIFFCRHKSRKTMGKYYLNGRNSQNPTFSHRSILQYQWIEIGFYFCLHLHRPRKRCDDAYTIAFWPIYDWLHSFHNQKQQQQQKRSIPALDSNRQLMQSNNSWLVRLWWERKIENETRKKKSTMFWFVWVKWTKIMVPHHWVYLIRDDFDDVRDSWIFGENYFRTLEMGKKNPSHSCIEEDPLGLNVWIG